MNDNYEKIVANLERMIEVMEYDGMRSPGKIKVNASNLVNMYELLDRYRDKIKTAEVVKPEPKKKNEEK